MKICVQHCGYLVMCDIGCSLGKTIMVIYEKKLCTTYEIL